VTTELTSLRCGMDDVGNDHQSSLLERLKAHDHSAQEELFNRYYRRCFHVARQILKNDSDADDQAQSAILSALVHIHSFEGRAHLGSWLHRIVTNGCYMRLRHNRRWGNLEITEVLCQLPVCSRPGSSPEKQMEREQKQALARREISHLPRTFRQVLVLRYLDERPLQEIALLTGESLSAIKSRLHRAKQELKSRLKEKGAAA